MSADQVINYCHQTNGTAPDPRETTPGNLITDSFVKSIRRMIKTSVDRNPDSNDKAIKDSFGKQLHKLVGQVVHSPK